MAKEQFLNAAEDCRWLKEVHLKGHRVPQFKSFILFGNEDWPDRLELYKRKNPLVTDKPTVIDPVYKSETSENPGEALILGPIGDVNPIEYGGGFIFNRPSSKDEPFIEYTYGLEGEENPTKKTKLEVYRVDIPDDVFKYHDWAKPAAIASSMGQDVEDLKRMSKSHNVKERAFVIEAIAGHYGWHELDQYTIKLSQKELTERWGLE